MFGEEIKSIRKAHGYTQKEVSKGTGIPQNTISWIESNKGIENIEQCVLLANFFEISIDELIGHDTANNTKKSVMYQNSVHNGNNIF